MCLAGALLFARSSRSARPCLPAMLSTCTGCRRAAGAELPPKAKLRVAPGPLRDPAPRSGRFPTVWAHHINPNQGRY